jgi:predicted transcriptional regulator
MVSRSNPPHRKTSAELLASSNLGSDARILDDKEVRQLLKQAVELEGSQVAFAKRHGIDRTHLVLVLQGKRNFSETILKLLGLRRVYTADRQ